MSKSRWAIVFLLVILGSTALFNIMFMIQTASKLAGGANEPGHVENDGRIQKQSSFSTVPSALYWLNDKPVDTIIGKNFKRQALNVYLV